MSRILLSLLLTGLVVLVGVSPGQAQNALSNLVTGYAGGWR